MPRTKLANPLRCPEHNLYDLRMRFPTTGNLWFVDSGAASGGNGLTPEGAVTTIDAAINLATASNGDIILVMEGHAETITGAAGIAQDVAGLTIVGLGRGRNRPVVTFGTAAAASWDITAASSYVENLVLVNGIDAQTAMVNIQAADCTIKGCEFMLGDATTQAVLGILTTDAADRLRIEDCFMYGTTDAGVTGAIRIVGGDFIILRNNFITGAFAVTGAVENVTTAGNGWLIEGNRILNLTADGNNKALVLHASTTALIARNDLAVIDSTGPAPWTAAGAYFGGNYHVAAVDTAGTLR